MSCGVDLYSVGEGPRETASTITIKEGRPVKTRIVSSNALANRPCTRGGGGGAEEPDPEEEDEREEFREEEDEEEERDPLLFPLFPLLPLPLPLELSLSLPLELLLSLPLLLPLELSLLLPLERSLSLPLPLERRSLSLPLPLECSLSLPLPMSLPLIDEDADDAEMFDALAELLTPDAAADAGRDEPTPLPPPLSDPLPDVLPGDGGRAPPALLEASLLPPPTAGTALFFAVTLPPAEL